RLRRLPTAPPACADSAPALAAIASPAASWSARPTAPARCLPDACSQCCRGDRDGDACEPHRDGATAAVRRPDCPEAADFAGGGLTVRMWRLVGRSAASDILRCNLVFIVVLLSLLAWVPACCIYEHSTQLSRRARADAVLPVYS
uniref:G_PROTEIN_RECEP_F1_2 domain-containing protein n=1 Tax=Macrostomum lignano TaxID=282301 RepID=A0A1I8GEV9_9PLAT